MLCCRSTWWQWRIATRGNAEVTRRHSGSLNLWEQQRETLLPPLCSTQLPSSPLPLSHQRSQIQVSSYNFQLSFRLSNLLAPQGALGGLDFYEGSSPIQPLLAFECIGVLPPFIVVEDADQMSAIVVHGSRSTNFWAPLRDQDHAIEDQDHGQTSKLSLYLKEGCDMVLFKHYFYYSYFLVFTQLCKIYISPPLHKSMLNLRQEHFLVTHI